MTTIQVCISANLLPQRRKSISGSDVLSLFVSTFHYLPVRDSCFHSHGYMYSVCKNTVT